jgi:class 3 adenylate cyclase
VLGRRYTDTNNPGERSIASDTPSELLTFLIADVRGYTRFTQERGDEAAARLVSKFSTLLRQTVETRGGRLIELRGDEALVVFGSARQALLAAVQLQTLFAQASQDDSSLRLPVGIGLDAGEAVPLDGGYRGDALNLAARLCNLAGPGEVLASEGVVYLGRRVRGLAYSERGLVSLKGFADPVHVIRVLSEGDVDDAASTEDARPQSTLPIGGFLGALPSGVMVGRTVEWDRILESVDEVTGSRGQLVLLSGEPGIGKTRLAQEVTLKVRNYGFLVATGRCYEQEQGVPFYPFLEALNTVFGAAPAGLRAEIPKRWPMPGAEIL